MDRTPPDVRCPPDMILQAPLGSPGVVVTWMEPTVSDNSLSPPTLLGQTRNSGDVFGPGMTMVTYTYGDASSNIGTCSFQVTVNMGKVFLFGICYFLFIRKLWQTHTKPTE